MADFEIAVAKTLANEGGDKYTETLGDRGGATKYGISIKFMVGVYESPDELKKAKGTVIERLFIRYPTKDTIRYLTECEAKFIYKMYFWDRNRYGEINEQDIADKFFDLSVLFGSPVVNKIIQYICDLKQDGIIGPKTILAINSGVSWFSHRMFKCFLLEMMCEALKICNKNKSQDGSLKGWQNRVMS